MGNARVRFFLTLWVCGTRGKIFKIIKKLADSGVIHNREQFKKVEGDFWEFKEFQRRILMYYLPNRRIVLTHGFIKKEHKIPKAEIDRAKTIMREYNQLRERFKP